MTKSNACPPNRVNNWLTETLMYFVEKRSGRMVTQTLEPGDRFKVSGERGWFIFRAHVLNLDNDAEWVDCTHATNKSFHAFRPERVTKKYRVIKRRGPRKKLKEAIDARLATV